MPPCQPVAAADSKSSGKTTSAFAGRGREAPAGADQANESSARHHPAAGRHHEGCVAISALLAVLPGEGYFTTEGTELTEDLATEEETDQRRERGGRRKEARVDETERRINAESAESAEGKGKLKTEN